MALSKIIAVGFPGPVRLRAIVEFHRRQRGRHFHRSQERVLAQRFVPLCQVLQVRIHAAVAECGGRGTLIGLHPFSVLKRVTERTIRNLVDSLLIHDRAFQLLQAAWAVQLLECVNYFEHWGLVRRGKRVDAVDSWDTDSWFTLYTLVGLSRHADHHAYATRPYPQLRHSESSPKLPRGYFGMVPLAMGANGKFRRLMTAELRRRGLGPFASETPA